MNGSIVLGQLPIEIDLLLHFFSIKILYLMLGPGAYRKCNSSVSGKESIISLHSEIFYLGMDAADSRMFWQIIFCTVVDALKHSKMLYFNSSAMAWSCFIYFRFAYLQLFDAQYI